MSEPNVIERTPELRERSLWVRKLAVKLWDIVPELLRKHPLADSAVRLHIEVVGKHGDEPARAFVEFDLEEWQKRATE